jgi:hypothetical protein
MDVPTTVPLGLQASHARTVEQHQQVLAGPGWRHSGSQPWSGEQNWHYYRLGSFGASRPQSPHKVSRRLTTDQREELIKAYASGTPSTRLMVDYSLSEGAVLKVLNDAGVMRKQRRHIAKYIEEAERLYIEEGWSLDKIGQHLGFAAGTVHRHLKYRAF